MSAYFMLIGHPHDSSAPVVIAGPEETYDVQREKFNADYLSARENKDFRRVDLVDSRTGVRKHKNLLTPEQAEDRKKAEAREKEAEAKSKKHTAEDEKDYPKKEAPKKSAKNSPG